MRLPVNIFLWTFTATLVPLVLLVWGVTSYSEQRFQEEITREIDENIGSVIGEMSNRMRYEREVVEGIGQAQEIQTMLNALMASSMGIRHPELTSMRINANRFLAGLQRTVPGLGSIRILDAAGNTIIKVTLGRVASPSFESLGQVNYVEEEFDNEAFLERLQSLPSDQISFMTLPMAFGDALPDREPSTLYAVRPLRNVDDRTAGYVVVNTFGEHLDQILSFSPRPRDGKIMIIEHNPGLPDRDGLVLYDDERNLGFISPFENGKAPAEYNARRIDNGAFWNAAVAESNGVHLDADAGTRYYYQEYHPYPHSLASWFVVFKLPADITSAPFRDIRLSLFGFGLLALLMSLLLAGLGARHFARPITRLSQSLKQFADGQRDQPMPVDSSTTEVRQLQTSFRYLTEQLASEARRRDRAEKKALQQAKLASIGEMAAGIGHEINNPLNNILTLTRLIERQVPAEDRATHEDMRDLRAEALRASRIVRGVMNFARQLPPQHETVELAEWLEEVVDRMEPEAMEADVHLALLSATARCQAEFDPAQMEQVVTNLIRNAIHASPVGGHILIQAECLADTIRIEIRDEGSGLPPDLIDQIFDPFFTTKDVDRGTGLGLSISLGIVQYHGGELSLENRRDAGEPDARGVIARVSLPKSKARPRVIHQSDTPNPPTANP
ncbi:sensor histidine kinase [Guyparkeria sp. 1SP6A2]|nr:sensor histidine kinase [Guyparkeria sp. 1SP6A2]